MSLNEAREQARLHAANGSVVIVYDAEEEEPIDGIHRRGE